MDNNNLTLDQVLHLFKGSTIDICDSKAKYEELVVLLTLVDVDDEDIKDSCIYEDYIVISVNAVGDYSTSIADLEVWVEKKR